MTDAAAEPNPLERARKALKDGGLTQALAATEIGISDSALSQWLAGKYGGDEAAVEEKVVRWLEARGEREELLARLPAPPDWANTPSSRRAIAGLTYAQMAGYIAVIHGGAGVGKTMAARRYGGLRPNVWIATMSPWTQTVHACLEQVAGACGLRTVDFRSARLAAALTGRLAGTRGLLVVDEAQHLGAKALEGLRSLNDATGTGLALVGSDLLYERLTGGLRGAEFAQLFSRIGKRVRLPAATSEDADVLLAAWGVEGKAEREFARGIANKPGGLRGLSHTLGLASVFAGDKAVSAEHLRAAWKDLGGVM